MALNTITPLTEYVFKVASVEQIAVDASRNAIVITLEYQNPESLSLAEQNYEFVQTEGLTEVGVAVQPYGAILMNYLAPTAVSLGGNKLYIKTDAGLLESNLALSEIDEVGATITFAASESEGGGEGGGGAA